MNLNEKSEDDGSVFSDLNDQVSNTYYKREFAAVIEEPVDEVDTDSIAGCMQQYQSVINSITMDSLRLDFTNEQSFLSDGLDPIRKLYIEKCNENIQLKHQVKSLKSKLAKRSKLDFSGLNARNSTNMFQKYSSSFESTMDMTATSQSRNHKGHILQKEQDIEKLKSQCDILITDINQKNETIRLLKEENENQKIRFESESVRTPCNECKYAKFDSKINGKKIKDKESKIQSLDEKLASAKRKIKNLSEMCLKLQQESNRYAKMPALINVLRSLFQKQKKMVLGHRRTSSSHQNVSILGQDDLSRVMSEMDLKIKELEREASYLDGPKEGQPPQGISMEVYNSVCLLDSNVYAMKKIFDSIGELLVEEDKQGNSRTVGKSRQSLVDVQTKIIDFRPFLNNCEQL